jgi:hypothetical protein
VKQLVDYAENEEKTAKPGSVENGRNTNALQSVLGYVSQEEKVGDPASVGSSRNESMSDSSMFGVLEGAADDNDALHMVMKHMSDQSQGVRYVTGINCAPETAVKEMMITKNRWPMRGNRLLFHGYQSFLPGEVTPDQAHRIGVQLAKDLWKDRFEIVVATHLDREHLHSHFVINSVSFLDGRKFDWDKEYPRMRQHSDELCRAEGLSVVQTDKYLERKLHRGEIRALEEGRPSIESIMKEDIDCCVKISDTLEEWLYLMRNKGYRIDDSGKYLRIFPYGHSRCIRVDRRFGEEYTIDGIACRIAKNGFGIEQRQKTEEEAINEIYLELSNNRENISLSEGEMKNKCLQIGGSKSRFLPGGPRGIQRTYVRFLFLIGYRKSPAQIARTHYLLREELTKLDRYIEESKFLIYEDIDTLEQLRERQAEDQKEVNRLYRSKNKLEKTLPFSDEREKASAREQIGKIEERIRKVRIDLGKEKAILKRMGEMEQKEQKAEMAMAGKSLRNNAGQRKNLRKEGERLSVMQI